MKKLLLLFYSLLVLSANAQTFVYHHMPTGNASWNMMLDWPCMSPFSSYQELSIDITGDTVISGLTYHKLFTPAVLNLPAPPFCFPGTAGPGYKGAFREDTLIRQVFIIRGSAEELLYDFNLQVGDTIKGIIASSFSADTVITIDSALVGGSYRKRWNCTYGITIVEGVGSNFGLMESSTNGAIGQFMSSYITCFSQDGISIFPNSSTSCPLITSVSPIENKLDEIRIFPNPSNGSFIVELPQNGIQEIVIRDLLGKLIFIQRKDITSTINIHDLHNGTYILTATDKNGFAKNMKIIRCP